MGYLLYIYYSTGNNPKKSCIFILFVFLVFIPSIVFVSDVLICLIVMHIVFVFVLHNTSYSFARYVSVPRSTVDKCLLEGDYSKKITHPFENIIIYYIVYVVCLRRKWRLYLETVCCLAVCHC